MVGGIGGKSSISSFSSPIYVLFKDHPVLFASQIRLLKKHSINYIRDCISSDGLMVDSLANIIHSHSVLKCPPVIPLWYSHLFTVLTVATNSRRLKSEFIAP